ncbi:hypothetical protein PDIDSM_6357 [Penicillium digitatum]|nr:hypothetical protein PDIDSM_6357 [Penicillium digitatum]
MGHRSCIATSALIINLDETSASELESNVSLPDNVWMEKQGHEGPPLVRLAPSNNFAGKTLKDIVTAHIQLDKEEIPRDDAGASGDLSWYPSAFLAVTSNGWKKHGIIFARADTEQTSFPVDCILFLPKDG